MKQSFLLISLTAFLLSFYLKTEAQNGRSVVSFDKKDKFVLINYCLF